MKKKRIVFLSIFIMVISITLTATKNVSADADTAMSACTDTINIEKSQDTISLIKTENTTITLPKWITVKDANNKTIDTMTIQPTRQETINNASYGDPESWAYSNFLDSIPTFSEDKIENQYYTQLAFWWLQDIIRNFEDNYNYNVITGIIEPMESSENEKYDDSGKYRFSNNLSALEKKTIKESPEGQKIEDFINIYREISQNPSQPPALNPIDTNNITYSVTDEYIETSLIKPEIEDKYTIFFEEYEVNVNEPIMIVDEKGNQKQQFSASEGFKLRIPLLSMSNKIDINVEIESKKRLNNWLLYWENQQSTTKGEIEQKNGIAIKCDGVASIQLFPPLPINYTLQTGNLNINVIDTETKEKLSNATISIFDRLGNMVYQTTTTNNEINVTLPVGEYTVKQTVTPENYQPVTIEKKVAVTENQESEAVLENIKLVEVPDLGQRVKGILTMIGGIAVIIGGIIIGITVRKCNKN